MQRKVLAASLALLVLGVAGCGGGSGPSTRAEFVQKGNALCVKARQQSIYGRQALHTDIPTRLLAYQTMMLAELRTLTPPKQMQAGLDEYERQVAAFSNVLRQYEHAPKRSRSAQANPAQWEIQLARLNTMARILGLIDCGH